MSQPHVLIIGAGISGLAFAHALQKHNISYTIFERDTAASIRAQGYRVRIAGGGIESLRLCLNDETWKLFEATCAEITPMHSRYNATDGSQQSNIGPGKQGPPGAKMGKGGPGPRLEMKHAPETGLEPHTVDRSMLRNLLLLDQTDRVKFAKTLERYELTSTGVKVFFTDGSSEEGTLLVGADGVASAVRKQFLPKVRYVDTGSRVIFGKTLLTPELESQFPAEALKGITVIQDQHPLTLFLEPIRFPKDASTESHGRLSKTPDYVYWVFGGNAETFGMSDVEFHGLSGQTAADVTARLTAHWTTEYRSMFALQEAGQAAPLRLISAKPERPEWDASDRVTLMGDAAHAMIPAGGSGANTALGDAALLAQLLVEAAAGRGVDEGTLNRYIDAMWEYALPSIINSAAAGEKLLAFKGFKDAVEISL